MELRLQVDPDRITLDDLIAVEESTSSGKSMRDLLCRFAVNGTDQPLELVEARKIVGAMTIRQVRDALGQFSQAMQQLREVAVPPTTPAA